MNFFQHIKDCFIKENRSNWLLFILFAGMILFKLTLFDYLYSHHVPVFSLWKNPPLFWTFYLPRIGISLSIASLLFLLKRKYWSIYISVLIDILLLANLWYYRSFDRFIDIYAIMMVGGLNDGYWDSIKMFIEWQDITFPILSILYGLAFLVADNRVRKAIITPIIILIAVIIHFGGMYLINDANIFASYQWENKVEAITLNDTDKQTIQTFIQPTKEVQPKSKLVLIIIESLESWAVHPTIMPHLWQFIQSQHVLYAPRITDQTEAAKSADAQIIANTGILPAKKGATCHLYMQNLFPSIADCYDSLTLSIASTPLDDCWHQNDMNKAFHFDTEWSRIGNDSLLFTSVREGIKQGFNYVQLFTISSHTPFDAVAKDSKLQLPTDAHIPQFLGDYIRSINVIDEGLAVLLSAIENDSAFQQTTVVITGDHTIFSTAKRTQYDRVCKEYDLPYAVADNKYVPLIIYSPAIDGNTRIEDICYQMDIYPTMLSCIGCDNYFWKGFGVNLLNSTARYHRPIIPEQASDLSDKVIRADYFRHTTY